MVVAAAGSPFELHVYDVNLCSTQNVCVMVVLPICSVEINMMMILVEMMMRTGGETTFSNVL